MKSCDWRKGCWSDAYGNDRYCYYHAKRRGETLTKTDEQDPMSSDTVEIRYAQRLLQGIVHRNVKS